MDIEARLIEIGISLPDPPTAIGNFVPCVELENILYLSGTYGTVKDEKGVDFIPKPGKVGAELTIEDGGDLSKVFAKVR